MPDPVRWTAIDSPVIALLAAALWGPGQTRKTIALSIINDKLHEQDETIVVQLANPVNGSLGATSAETFTIVDDDAPPDPAGNTQATALPVDLFTMPRQVLTNTLSVQDSDMYRVDLRQGDLLAIDVDPMNLRTPGLGASILVITAPDGSQQRIGASREPDTGLATQNPAFGLRATVAGTYYLLLSTRTPVTSGYSLEFHRLALAEGPQDPTTLQQTGPMYAFLNAGGDTLSFTGPTGYGFAITGNWTQTTALTGRNRLPASNYTATGRVALQTALGPLTMLAV